jgi:hypothetical protein
MVVSKSLGEWLEMSWENKSECTVRCVQLNLFLPRGWGLASPFIGQGGGELHARRAT